MTAWQDILSIAAVGTERQEVVLAHAGDALGRALSRLDASDREGTLLGAVALASLYRQAGLQPALDPHALPEACEPDEAACCSSEAGQHLALMLEGGFKEVLPEWLAELRKARRRVPAEYLPALLDKGRGDRSLRHLIAEAAGSRGRWLAAQQEEWRWATRSVEPGVWETGSRDERLYLLRTLRESEPDKARELLASTWKSEAAKDRALFLEEMLNGLGASDEPFLTETLQDRSAEVRRAGGELLLRLPSSRLRQLVIEKVGALLSFKKPRLIGKASIEVEPPRDPEKWQKENGVQIEPADGAIPKGLGKKGWWLLHAVGWVPPETWCRAWGRKPAEVLDAANQSEWKEALLAGLIMGAMRYGDTQWGEIILTHKQFRQDNMWETNAHLTELASHLPAPRFEALILAELRREKKGLRSEYPSFRLLVEHKRAWGDELSRAVVAAVKERIGGIAKNEIADWEFKVALGQFAFYVSPDLFDELSAGWPSDAEGWWQGVADEFQTVLRFRRDMRRAILKEGNN